MFYRFILDNTPATLYPDLDRFVRKTRQEADAGSANSQLLYGMLLAGLPQLKRPRSEAMPWFLKAAQQGAPVAQYQIGFSLLAGWGCACEENKGLEWMRMAAEQDQPDAQVALAEFSLRGSQDLESFKRAKLWLERAAASNSRDGKLYLSALLASAPFAELRDPVRALPLIDDVFGKVDDDPTAHEIRAAAEAAGGHFKQAVTVQSKAIAMARRLSWDLTALNERLAHYQSGQPWYGNLLDF
jgi:TPR repeat protein